MLEKSDIELLGQMMDEKIGSSENRMMAYFEGKIEPQLQLLAEGHQQLLETLAPVSR